ncbi:hypothetical protein IAT38_002430 [Cryptococcus sp. DSM 104549]
MSMAAPRPFAAPSYPTSPSPTTASSLGYSQYGSQSFAGGPTRQLSTSSSAFGSGSAAGNARMGGSAPARSGAGLKPPSGERDRKGESREVARVHWRALREFLQAWLDKESPTARASAREKLTRLTKLQFQELSTDVYDELMRRLAVDNGDDGNSAPFLPVREDFHPKRNQARQKLATLPKNRFKDLASDVFYELRRRYPEFEEEQQQQERQRSYDEPPPAPGPRPGFSTSTSQNSIQSLSRDRSNPTPPPANPSRLVSSSSQHQRQGSRGMSLSSHRSRPSRDRGGERGQDMDPEEEILNDDDERGGRQVNPMAATSEVVVPNKSRLREEDIEVPYARDSTVDMIRRSGTSSRPESRSTGRDSRASYGAGATPSVDGDRSRMTPRQNSGYSLNDAASPTKTEDKEYYDRMSFSSNVTGKSRGLPGGGTAAQDEERDRKLRSEYEFRIAGLDRRVAAAEKERDEALRAEAQAKEIRDEWEAEVRSLKERAATHASSLRSIQHELDLARDQTEASRQRADQVNAAAEEDIAQWRDRYEALEQECRRLEDEKATLEDELERGGRGGNEPMGDIKAELDNLVDELNTLSMRNDELMGEREQDAMHMNDMEARVEEYKRKYDAVRIELRNLKATSIMFVSKPVSDDHLPASADGNILDVNVSAFQSAIDGLLAAARSSAPSGVLPAMKAIVEAITSIGEDVKAFENNPNLDVDVSRLESLKYESTNRLNALMQASRNHAMASGLSPLSLLDAAAGHLSANVVEIIKLLKIKRSEKKDLRRSRSSMSIRDMVNRDKEKANGGFDREYGQQGQASRTSTPDSRGPEVIVNRPSMDSAGGRRVSSRIGLERSTSGARTATPVEIANAKLNGSAPPSSYNPPSMPSSASASASAPTSAVSPVAPNPITSAPASATSGPTRPDLRINSFQSTSTSRSDSFELERKSALMSDRTPLSRAEPPTGRSMSEVREDEVPDERDSFGSTGTASSNGPMTALGSGQPFNEVVKQEEEGLDDGQEWEDLRPYLNAQSSALVNSIQNLLAAIRTNSSSPALNEHLSEVIAIASSIVAVSTNALPSSLRGQGDGLLRQLVDNTNKLSEAQEMGSQGGGGQGQSGFEKGLRQQIASASFGVAKSLKALMKLGGAE